MRIRYATLVLLSLCACIQTGRASAAATSAGPSELLAFSANGSQLRGGGIDGSEDGVGGSVSWLHYFDSPLVLGAGAEYQSIADSSWTFGALRGSYSWGEPGKQFSVLGELQLGSGDDDGRGFDYSVAVLSLNKSFSKALSLQLETRQIDIDITHGNLPKFGIAYLFSPKVLGTFSYAHSVGGNLGTEIYTGRIDYYGPHFNLMAGAAGGQADSSAINLPGGITLPANDLAQGFVGIGKTFPSGQLQMVIDYLEFGSTDKVTVILSYTAYLGARGTR